MRTQAMSVSSRKVDITHQLAVLWSVRRIRLPCATVIIEYMTTYTVIVDCVTDNTVHIVCATEWDPRQYVG